MELLGSGFHQAGFECFHFFLFCTESQEFDYTVEPNIFHDLFGHVPLLFNPVIADYVQHYGQGGLKAERLGACEMLSRLYWCTIEFGLIRENGALRAYGAGRGNGQKG